MDKDIKISNDTKWGEKPLGPSIKRPFSREDIKEFRSVLAKSYGCRPDDIIDTYEVLDMNYYNIEDFTSYIWLTFKLKFIDENTKAVNTRRIYRLRVDIPEEVKKKINDGIKSGMIVIPETVKEANTFVLPGSKETTTVQNVVDANIQPVNQTK